MIEKDDWRLHGQDFLFGKSLHLKKWIAPSAKWDHDHCVFCWDKFSDSLDTLHEGYTTDDIYAWICPTCYDDFKDMFKWTVVDETN